MKGFIVCPEYKVINDKPYVLLYGRLENKESFLTINEFRPYFYIKEADLKKALKLEKFESEKTDSTNFKKEKGGKVIQNLPSDIQKLRKKLEDENIECYEADFKFPYRFMFDLNLKGTINLEGSFDKEDFIDRVYRNPEITPTEFFPKLKILSIDIETCPESKELYSMSLYSENFSLCLIISDKKVKGAESFEEEYELLERFVKIVHDFDPDVITGWNIIDFDLAFLKKRFEQQQIPFTIGRTNEAGKLSIESDFFRTSKATIPGRQTLDALSLVKDPYLKDSPFMREKKFENYKLETIATVLLGKNKLIDKTKDKCQEITRLFKEDKEGLAQYNLNDARLVYEILEETKLLDILIERSILTGMPLDRVNASIASMDSLYLREARKRKLVLPSNKFSNKENPITGGYVMASKPGIYDNILVFDFKSLYPSLMRTFNIDPASYLEKKEKNSIETPNKAYFKNEDGILPTILEKLTEARAKAKKENKQLTSQAIKITMNSMFGSIASPASRFFNMQIANAITTSGQFIIKKTAEEIEKIGYEVIYSDTDSVFINSKIENSEKAEKIGKEIEEKINLFYKKYIKENYNRDSKLELEFEKNYIRFLMPKVRGGEAGAKKRYAGLLKNNKIEVTGLEAVRGDWVEAAQKFQLELLDKVFHKKEVTLFVKEFVNDLKKGKYDNLLVYRKQLRKNIEDYAVNPPHVKAIKKLKEFNGDIVEYYITEDGPEVIYALKHKIDHQHYLNKQLKPIADSILVFFNTSFEEIIESSKQKNLFNFK